MRDKMLRGTYRLLLALAPLLFALPTSAVAVCATDLDCSDDLFCNGNERCTPGAPGADSEGCTADPGGSPCVPPDTCDEATARCVPPPCPDNDGDGHEAAACGGDDCDDSDSRRYPGNAEICDAADHDEDCDPSTFGIRDADDDGYADARCCNVNLVGTRRCGADCDDANFAIYPSVMVCESPSDPTSIGVLVCTGHPDAFPPLGYELDRCRGLNEACVHQPTGIGVCAPIPPAFPPGRGNQPFN